MPVKYASTFCSVNFNRDTTFDGATSCVHACMHEWHGAFECAQVQASFVWIKGHVLHACNHLSTSPRAIVITLSCHDLFHIPLLGIATWSDLFRSTGYIDKVHALTEMIAKIHATQARWHFECFQFKFGQWRVHFVGNPPCIERCKSSS